MHFYHHILRRLRGPDFEVSLRRDNRPSLAIRILTSAAAAVALASSAYSQATPPPEQQAPSSTASEQPEVKMPAFNVTGSYLDPYNAAQAVSSARTSTDILDTAMTVNVVTPALMQDINPETLLDVTGYFAGVSNGRGSGEGGINDRQTFRGFESFARSVDNFTESLMPYGSAADNNVVPFFFDHVELIMGPDSILSPSGTPGGTVNAFSKSPLFTQSTEFSAKVGNYDGNQFTFDTTGPIGDGKHMAYRFLGLYQDAAQYTPGSVITFAGAAEFTYKFSDSAQDRKSVV